MTKDKSQDSIHLRDSIPFLLGSIKAELSELRQDVADGKTNHTDLLEKIDDATKRIDHIEKLVARWGGIIVGVMIAGTAVLWVMDKIQAAWHAIKAVF